MISHLFEVVSLSLIKFFHSTQ